MYSHENFIERDSPPFEIKMDRWVSWWRPLSGLNLWDPGSRSRPTLLTVEKKTQSVSSQ